MGPDRSADRDGSRKDPDRRRGAAVRHRLADEALASIERVRKKARAEAVKLARSLGRATNDDEIASVTGAEEVLAGFAFMFSALWVDDVLRRALNPSLPAMQNTDGEPLEFITLHFPLQAKRICPRSDRRSTRFLR